jgi:hypothetical protein
LLAQITKHGNRYVITPGPVAKLEKIEPEAREEMKDKDVEMHYKDEGE